MEGEQHVRRIEVAQVQQRPIEALVRVGIARHLGIAAAGHGRRQVGRVVALAGAGAVALAVVPHGLLGVAGEVRLDVHDGRLAEAGQAVVGAGAQPLHEQPEVLEVAGHEAGIVQVGEVLLRLAAAATRAVTLQQLVVGKDRDVVV